MAEESEYVLVYMTAGNMKEASTIKEAILKERLVACVNMFPIQSAWWWKGKLEQGNEVALLAKTRRHFVKDVIQKVKAVHSYDVPCVLVLPIIEGNPEFLDWIEKVTVSKDKGGR